MDKANSIQEIKDEYAKELNQKSWRDFVWNHFSGDLTPNSIERHFDEVCKRYASQFQSQIVLPKEDLLEKYSMWLMKHGYMDTDWKDEKPFAIDEFLKTIKQK